MENIKEIVLKNKEVKAFIAENNVSVDSNLIPLYSFVSKQKQCSACKGLEHCTQEVRGQMPTLEFDGSRITVPFTPCHYLVSEKEQLQKQSNLKTIACSLDGFDYEKVEVNPARNATLSKIKSILTAFKEGNNPKGIYLYGKYGCGKSYLLGFLAKRLSDGGMKVIYAYYPDLVRKIKSSISTGKLEDIVDELKVADCLILDDFGGEQNSEFIRDEVLGAILQDRMMNNLFTCMTSNINPELLVDHISNGNKEIDVVKASRIYERIKTLMEFVELDDKNYR